MSRLYGIIPPTTTPFTADGAIDESAARTQVREAVAAFQAGGGAGSIKVARGRRSMWTSSAG